MTIKPEARLTSALLARKGNAQPFPAKDVFSLPPQTAVDPGAGASEQAAGRRIHPEGWPSPAATFSLRRPERPAPEPARKAEAAPSSGSQTDPSASLSKKRVALTLRVDHDRHRRLRILAAQTGRSSQEIMMTALDAYVDGEAAGEICECLKAQARCAGAGKA
jgi:predicted transcriptional regulator